MAKHIVINLLILLLLSLSALAAPAEDLVTIPIAGYNQHKWYSGICAHTQAI